MAKVFLTAEWRHLCLLTYSVPDELIQKRLPKGFEIDRYQGSACVSFVAFDFQNTRVLGIPWPGYTNFPEINLRFYVKGNGRRGVMFVKELVPSRLVAACARWSYNEPYERVPMHSKIIQVDEHITVRHTLHKAGKQHALTFSCKNAPYLPKDDSIEHFFKEHQWGFGIDRKGRALQYEVQHPHWNVLPVEKSELNIDFRDLYGDEWAFLNQSRPLSQICAEGSRVAVFLPTKIGLAF